MINKAEIIKEEEKKEIYSYNQVKLNPGVYKALDYDRFVSFDNIILFITDNEETQTLDYNSWKNVKFVKADEEIVLRFKN